MGLGGVSGPTMAVGVAPPPAPGFYSSPSTMTSFSSPSKEMAVSSAAPALAMFCRSSIGVPDLPYKLDGPATDTLRTLWSLELGRRWESIPPLRAGAWGPSAAEHPLMPWSFMYLRPRRFSDKADYAPILDSATLGGGLDDVVDSRPGEAPVAEMEYRDPVGPEEPTLDRADPAQAFVWGAGPRVLSQSVGG